MRPLAMALRNQLSICRWLQFGWVLGGLVLCAGGAFAQVSPSISDAKYVVTSDAIVVTSDGITNFFNINEQINSGPLTGNLQVNISTENSTQDGQSISRSSVGASALPIASVMGASIFFVPAPQITTYSISTASLTYSMLLQPLRPLQIEELGLVANGVPINMFARLSASASGSNSNSSARLIVSEQGPRGTLFDSRANANCMNMGVDCSRNQELVIGTQIEIDPDIEVLISLFASGSAHSFRDRATSGGEYQTIADPIFAIDPSFSLANAFTLVYSQNMMIAANPVPEPEIYAMLGLGLGLMGWVGRRKKLQVVA